MAFIRNISRADASDDELLESFRKRHQSALLAELYDRYIEMVYAVCLKYLHEPETAKDAVMDIYEGLGEKVLRHQILNFRSWLYTVVKNHCLMQLRTASRTRHVNIDEGRVQSAGETHQEEDNKEEDFRILDNCLESLSADQKKIIDLFYLQQKCYKDISVITGLDWNKVRSLVQNGRRNLKICMEKEKSYEQK